ncbi:recombinase family protein [Sphingomonas sp.]|uniref:recombinase family protein n=1 Tax=Sphingomonas sp. TaxID=28214 RepID=UPI0038A81911
MRYALASQSPPNAKRCAIYTRKSSEQGLEHNFSSLEAQREICSAYIASQSPNGWSELPKHYDDGGYSGGTLMRPALQELLADVEAGVVDNIVIYKLDRISRSLIDFIRLMDLLQSYDVGFVAVTQNFDTGDSTGRLILNVLLTFAQFEREIASDRLKDKFTAMRQRGMFVGGNVPFGFNLLDKKLVINPAEAAVVRWMFNRYLETKGMARIAKELRAKGVVRRSRISKRGRLVQGRPISTSAIFYMLANPIYVGEVFNNGKVYPGLHEPIVDGAVWDEVQALRAKRTRAKVVEIYKTDLLRDLMYDCYGRKMGVYRDHRYAQVRRYYISNQSEWGRRNGVRRYRTKADELEQLVVAAIASHFADRERIRSMLIRAGIRDERLNKLSTVGQGASRWFATASNRQKICVLQTLIARIELSGTLIKIMVRVAEIPRILQWDRVGLFRADLQTRTRSEDTEVIEVPATTICMKRELTLLLKKRGQEQQSTPNRRLIGLLSKARQAQAALDERTVRNVTELAAKVHCHPKRFTRVARLNYLAPDIVAAIRDGTQPPDLNCKTLMSVDLPMDWSLQRRLLGFADQPDFLRAAPGW